ncbi:MAG: nucleoside monophosphate kinase [Candidatus Yanofskybacteria bacterium]|nr:nucleoside monophosphate kinase [Candidatus Yanofskybacteria bacterium]
MNGPINKQSVVILIGPPGSGKGTQAELLAEKFGLFHLESSKVIEEKIKNADPNDEILQKEKGLWESGKLNTPELVLEWIKEKAKEVASEGHGIVFSGSPRTLYEAEGEMPLLEKLYEKDNIKIINIELNEEESIKRNSKRRICKDSRHPIPNFPEFENITKCPKDGSEIITRLLDNPETIEIRLQEYANRTVPIIDFLKKRNYKIMETNGEQPIEKVFRDILEKIN